MFNQKTAPVRNITIDTANIVATDGVLNVEVQRDRLKTIVEIKNEETLE